MCVNASSEAGACLARDLARTLEHDFHVRAIGVEANVADADDVAALVEEVLGEFGRIDVLVNNAGITRDGLAMRMSEADFDDVIAVNLKGAFLCSKAVSRIMMKQRFGRIVNMSSIAGVYGNAGQANYAASKAGLIGLTKSLARELGGRGITVNAVAPGFIETDMTAALNDKQREGALSRIPCGRFGAAQDVAAAVRFLASDEAGYVTGQVIGVDGGMTL